MISDESDVDGLVLLDHVERDDDRAITGLSADLTWQPEITPGVVFSSAAYRCIMLPSNNMSTPLRNFEAQLAALSPTEKIQALRMLALQVADVWPGIERTPGVAGGTACIVGTRIPVWTLERYRQLGWTEAQLLENFPTLRAVDLVGAWAYVGAYRDEVEQDIHSNEAA